jgi:HD-GYP domain-containing protein (c-di-GMP phosphodiesterase class II)
MNKTKDLRKLRREMASQPVFVALESLYSRNESSPISRNKSSGQKYAEMSAMLTDYLHNKLNVASVQSVRDLSFSGLFSVAEMIVYCITKTPEMLVEVMNPVYAGDFLAHHSLNVAFLSSRVGLGLGLDYKQLTELSVAAILHDIGMTKLDADCYLHDRPLSKQERDAVEQHPYLGWQFFEKLSGDFPWLLRVIEEEHLREHGQGYPAGKKGELHIYSKIIGVCDAFEALSHQRLFRKAFHPAEVMKTIIAAKEFVFAKDILRAVVESLSLYPVGSLVQLNNKKIAFVAEAIEGYPLRPTVWVIGESPTEPAQVREQIELSKETNLYVTGLVYNDQYQRPESTKAPALQ